MKLARVLMLIFAAPAVAHALPAAAQEALEYETCSGCYHPIPRSVLQSLNADTGIQPKTIGGYKAPLDNPFAPEPWQSAIGTRLDQGLPRLNSESGEQLAPHPKLSLVQRTTHLMCRWQLGPKTVAKKGISAAAAVMEDIKAENWRFAVLQFAAASGVWIYQYYQCDRS